MIKQIAQPQNNYLNDHSQTVVEVTDWVGKILSRDSLFNDFENTIETLISQTGPFLIPNFAISEMVPALHFLSIWLMNGIHQAKTTPYSIEATEDQRFESIIDNCRKGFIQAEMSTKKCLATKDNVTATSYGSNGFQALYALLEDFDETESVLINRIIKLSDIENCPAIPDKHHDEILESLFNQVFDDINIEIDDIDFILSGIENMSESLSDNPCLLALISTHVLELELAKEKPQYFLKKVSLG